MALWRAVWKIGKWAAWAGLVLMELLDFPQKMATLPEKWRAIEPYLLDEKLHWAILVLLAIGFLVIDISPKVQGLLKRRRKPKTHYAAVSLTGKATLAAEATVIQKVSWWQRTKLFFSGLLSNKRMSPTLSGDWEANFVLLWIINSSAWMRWQEAQHLANNGKPLGEWLKKSSAETAFRMQTESGQLTVRARRRDSLEYEEIPPDVWKSTYLDFQPDPNTIWRGTMKGRTGLSWEAVGKIPDYVSFQVSKEKVLELWPKKDLELDALTKKLNKQGKKRKASRLASDTEDSPSQ